ncbi:MAG: carbohydrate ABC transporter permease [Blautia sp.]|nr:carbohydrate ABC transporter permease [Eubacteriales bacterium]MED9967530.1 carbohydrate ABC transporter permease [Blautia sp.]
MKKKHTSAVQSMNGVTKAVTYICLAWALFVSLMPVVWLVLSSLKKDPLARPGFQLPESICIDGYISTFTDLHVVRYFANSMIIAGISVAISILMISMSAYVVARMEFKGKGFVNMILYSTMFIPATALTYPVYNLVNKLHIYNTRGALIFIYACSGIALSFFVIKNYYANIPHELEEAARIDGCGYAMTWWKVIFPIARPGIMTAAVLAFLNNWNEYYWASLVIVDREKLTVPALLSTFTTSFRTNYNGLFSAMVVIILPPIILYCVFSKFFVEALSGGAVKG